MESKKKHNNELLAKIKDIVNRALVTVSSKKPALPRRFPSVVRLTTNKTKSLKAKYSRSRMRPSIHRQEKVPFLSSVRKLSSQVGIPQFLKKSPGFIKNIGFPKFSLSQLSVPGGLRKYFSLKITIAALAVVALTVGLVKVTASVDALAVEINGKQVALVTNKADAEKLLSDLKAEKARIWKRDVDVTQTLTFKNTKAKKYQLDNLITLKNKLNKNLSFVAVATGIKVNGQLAVAVKDEAAAADVLQKLKDAFEISDVQVESVSFQEKVELAQVPVSLSEVLSTDKAVALLKEGKQKKVIHTVVQGDSLWSIARHYDMHVADLLKINPSIKGEHLDLGQEINLVATEPIINVLATGKQTVKETIPYKVVVETDKSIWRGRQQIKTKGQNGLREVTYQVVFRNGSAASKQVLQEKVFKEAKNQVVVKGSKYVVASRSGSGVIGWPIRGKISSSYGRRWGSMHTGIDIDGYTGQPVGAAAVGTVVSAGWDGGYGKQVTIRHSNGMTTKYAHLSKIEVSVGQSVEKGDLIGLVGSTGRSTGSHLHFEVLVGGSFRNPLNMLR